MNSGRRPLWLRVSLFVTFAVCAATTPVLWLSLDEWLGQQRDLAWNQLETAIGHRITYERVAPNVLSALDFQRTRLLAADGSPILTAASIRLSLDWSMVLQGQWAKALDKIQIINGVLTVDAQRDETLIRQILSLAQNSRSPSSNPLSIEVEAFNLSGRWTDGTRFLSLDRGFFVLRPESGTWRLRYRGSLTAEDRSRIQTWASVIVGGTLVSDNAFENLSIRVSATHLKTALFDLEPVTAQIKITPAEISISKVSDAIPLDLQLQWNRVGDRWALKAHADEFVPSQWIHFKESSPWSRLAEGTFSGQLDQTLGGHTSFDGQVRWPQGTLPGWMGKDVVLARGKFWTETGVYRFSNLSLETGASSIRFSGDIDTNSLLPSGQLTVNQWALGSTGVVRGQIDFVRNGREVSFQGNSLSWNSLAPTSVTGALEHEGDTWKLDLQGPGFSGSMGPRFGVHGLYTTVPNRFTLEAQVADLPIDYFLPEWNRIAPGVAPPRELTDLILTSKVQMSWDDEGFALSQGQFQIADSTGRGRGADGVLSWSAGRLDFSIGHFLWDGTTGSMRATADFLPTRDVDWTVSGELWNQPFALRGRWANLDRTLVVRGDSSVLATLHQTGAGEWNAAVDLPLTEFAPGWKSQLQASCFWSKQEWRLDVQRLTLSGHYPWNHEEFMLDSRWVVLPSGFFSEGLDLVDKQGRLAGQANATWDWSFGRPWQGRISLKSPESDREVITLDGSLASLNEAHAVIQASGLNLSRIDVPLLQGRVATSGRVDWQAGQWNWVGQLALSEARYGDSPVGFRVAASGTNSEVVVQSLSLSLNPVRVTDFTGRWDIASGIWKLSSGMGFRFGSTDLESHWDTTGRWVPNGLSTFVVETRATTWSRKPVSDSIFTGSWDSSGWRANNGAGGLTVQGEADGTFTAHAQQPFFVQGLAEGSWKNSMLAVGVRDFRMELGFLKELLPSPLFSVSSGFAEGTFSLSGSLSDPEINGTLVLRNLVATSSFVRNPVGPVNVPVLLEGHRLRIEPVNIGPQGQTWLVSGGARVDHLQAEEFQFQIQTDSISVIPASYQFTGISAVGNASGTFIVKGSPLALTLGGKLLLQDTTITLKDTSASTDVSSKTLGYNVDLVLLTGRKVEFLWPNETLPWLRAVTASNQMLTIRANDVASTWSVSGKLALRTGEINYLNRTFVLREGVLTFQENETGFDPRINVRAEWKIRETTGNTIINLRADGPLARFSPRFDATPYKSPDELQQLVGTTLALPTDYTKSTSVDTALSVASDVGTSFLLTPFEETVKKNFNLDLFTVKTEILKKSLLNRNGPLEASDYLDNTRLFFGKYIGDDLFLQGTLAFRRDSTIAAQVSPKMVVEPELQAEFQTPFFLLNWTLLPQHPETLFVADNTVTFRWDWSY